MASATLDAYLNDLVFGAQNPSEFGYHHGPLYPGQNLLVSGVNTSVCDVVVDITGTMCGKTFLHSGHARNHIRKKHPFFNFSPGWDGPRVEESTAGAYAIKRWVLYGGWRHARYKHEPARFHPESPLLRYATELEQLAETNSAFQSSFGSSFHRPSVVRSTIPRPLAVAAPDSYENIPIEIISSDEDDSDQEKEIKEENELEEENEPEEESKPAAEVMDKD